jgi:hypothetical protein
MSSDYVASVDSNDRRGSRGPPARDPWLSDGRTGRLGVTLSEEWTFDFDGTRVRRLQMVRVDPDPSDRVLALGLGDLERWEALLRETHPDQAVRLLPAGPDVFAHYYFRFGLDASPDEIGASIEEYLESRDPLVGTYVCSEDWNPDVTHRASSTMRN